MIVCMLSDLIRLPLLSAGRKSWYIIIIVVFGLGSDKLGVLFILLSFPMDQSRDEIPRLREGELFFIFDCSSPFFFLLIEFHYVFSPSLIQC